MRLLESHSSPKKPIRVSEEHREQQNSGRKRLALFKVYQSLRSRSTDSSYLSISHETTLTIDPKDESCTKLPFKSITSFGLIHGAIHTWEAFAALAVP